MNILPIPDLMLGDHLDQINIFFYIRERGPDQINLKLNYTQNMLCFMIHGVKEIIDETRHYRMDNEQIGLVTSGNMLMTERVTLRQEFESLLIFFSNDFLSDFTLKHELNFQPLEVDAIPPVINFPKDDYLLNFQKSMKMLENNFHKKNFRLTKLEEILLYLYDKYPVQISGFIGTAITKTQNNAITDVVQNHKFGNLKTEELAFLCNMSLSTFKRKFFEVYQTSPKKYMISEKMKKVRLLLLHKKRPSDIYYELGYETFHHSVWSLKNILVFLLLFTPHRLDPIA